MLIHCPCVLVPQEPLPTVHDSWRLTYRQPFSLQCRRLFPTDAWLAQLSNGENKNKASNVQAQIRSHSYPQGSGPQGVHLSQTTFMDDHLIPINHYSHQTLSLPIQGAMDPLWSCTVCWPGSQGWEHKYPMCSPSLVPLTGWSAIYSGLANDSPDSQRQEHKFPLCS